MLLTTTSFAPLIRAGYAIVVAASFGWTTIALGEDRCPPTTVYFGNGVLTAPARAEETLSYLKSIVGDRTPDGNYPIDFQRAYASTSETAVVGFFIDLVESFRLWLLQPDQVTREERKVSWSAFEEHMASIVPKGGPPNFAGVLTSYSDKDLREMVRRYKEALQEGKRIVVLAHSQGNMYANAAREELAVWAASGHLRHTLPFSIVSIATPATYIAGLNPSRYDGNRRYYLTNVNDYFMKLVPDKLAPNDSLPTNLRDLPGHGMYETYLTYRSDHIVSMVREAMKRTPSSCVQSALSFAGPFVYQSVCSGTYAWEGTAWVHLDPNTSPNGRRELVLKPKRQGFASSCFNFIGPNFEQTVPLTAAGNRLSGFRVFPFTCPDCQTGRGEETWGADLQLTCANGSPALTGELRFSHTNIPIHAAINIPVVLPSAGSLALPGVPPVDCEQ